MVPIIEFVLGIAVLVYSAEKLIGYLVGVASRWAVSLFLIAVVFTGIEFDDLAFGIVLNLEDLSQVALGTVIGTTIAMTGLVLALEPMLITGGTDAYVEDPDGWTLRSADGTRAAHIEHTVAVTENGSEVLTRLARTPAAR